MEIAKYVTKNGTSVNTVTFIENGVTKYETRINTAVYSTPYYRGFDANRANKAFADAVKMVNKRNN